MIALMSSILPVMGWGGIAGLRGPLGQRATKLTTSAPSFVADGRGQGSQKGGALRPRSIVCSG